MPRLLEIIASTRPGRVGLPVGRWFQEAAIAHGGFEVTVADLAEIRLPFMDEPNHPRLRRYSHQHTRDWSATVEAADAVVIVMPEYNYGYTAPIKNALDYLFEEWQYKPLGLVGYGGVAAGTRAQQLLRPVVTALRMVVASQSVLIPYVTRFLADDGSFVPDEEITRSAKAMLDELLVLHGALAPLRPART